MPIANFAGEYAEPPRIKREQAAAERAQVRPEDALPPGPYAPEAAPGPYDELAQMQLGYQADPDALRARYVGRAFPEDPEEVQESLQTGLPTSGALAEARRSAARGSAAAARAEDASEKEARQLEAAAGTLNTAAAEQQRIYTEHERELRELQGRRREAVEQKMAVLNRFADNYANAVAQGVRPAQSLIDDRTEAGIVATVVHGLGALAQIVSRGNMNPLAEVAGRLIDRADKAIERDIQARFARIDNLGRAMTVADRQLQSVRSMFDDDAAALQYLVGVQRQRTIEPLLRAAESGKNLAAAAGSRALAATTRAKAEGETAQIQAHIAQIEQKNAQLAMAAERQDGRPFMLPKDVGQAEAKAVRDEWAKARTFAFLAKKLVHLRSKMSAVQRLTNSQVTELWEGAEGQGLRNEYASLVMEIFGVDADMGKALTETEIKFGFTKIGRPEDFLTTSDKLSRAMRSKIGNKVRLLSDSISARGGSLTATGRQQLVELLEDIESAPVERQGFGPARSQRR